MYCTPGFSKNAPILPDTFLPYLASFYGALHAKPGFSMLHGFLSGARLVELVTERGEVVKRTALSACSRDKGRAFPDGRVEQPFATSPTIYLPGSLPLSTRGHHTTPQSRQATNALSLI